MKRSVLIIGGAGYIGSVLTSHLLAKGYRVTVLDLLIYENHLCVSHHLGDPNYRFVFGDLTNRQAVSSALDGVTDVVLLAGLVGDPITREYPRESQAINDYGMLRCMDCLDGHDLNKVVFVSTCSNYGVIPSNQVADEAFPLKPLSSYARSKVAAEGHLLAKKGAVDFTATILRFATAFGLSPRMRFDLTVNEFTRELAAGRELVVFDAQTWRPYCHVRDFAILIDTVLRAPRSQVAFEVFNAGGDANNFTKQGIVDTILTLLPNGKVTYQERGSDPRNYRVNFTKVRDVLGFIPSHTVEYGVREIIGAIREHVFDRADLSRNFHGNYEIDYPTK